MQPLAVLVSALGIAQLISWGTLFYAVGVLGEPMRRELGVSELFTFGAFTAGLLTSGALSPLAGRLIDRRGGRFVLSTGSLLGATAMLLLATAAHPAVIVLGWVVAGAAMAACLYDPAFAALSQHLTGLGYRRAVTALTIFGGFASTVFWPLSHVLMTAWGWRSSLAVYAALHLLVCLPIHLVFLPRRPPGPSGADAAASPVSANLARPGLRLLAAAFAAASFVSAVIAVHVVSLLVSKGLTQAQAISIAMLFGPMQVVGRAAELAFASRIGVIAMGSAALALLGTSVAVLGIVDGIGVLALVFVVAYGFGNGLFTIMRGTVPAELYGREGLGATLGRLARAGLYARALAPASFSGMVAVGLTRNAALATLTAVAIGGLAAYLGAVRIARGTAARPSPRVRQ